MNKINFLIVLQTHSRGNRDKKIQRYCKADKAEVMRRCTRSLIESVNYACDFLPNFQFELVVLDDHSDSSSIEKLKINLNIAKFKTHLKSLRTHGVMPSILACYEYGKKYGVDWIYFVQDDYLYEQTAIHDMIVVGMETSYKLQNYTCVFPYNDPYRYTPENTAILSHIIQSQGRHWRTQLMTSSCFMIHHSVLLKEWDLFENMGKHKVSPDMEDRTINQLFRSRGYYLFVPIPSLALHMQGDTEKDPFINWREWWDRYESVKIPEIDITQKNLLHIGFAGQKYSDNQYNHDLKDYKEITLDIDKTYNPDIVADVKDLSALPSESFDCIFASHILEHIHYFLVPTVLKEFQRILKPNGFARIVVPNIKIVSEYLENDCMLDTIYESNSGPVTALDLLYSQKYYTRKNSFDFAFHKTGFTKGIVKKISEEHNIAMTTQEVNTDLIINLSKKHIQINNLQ